jgi:transcriptional regulator with PAS, ATPase and Fis domain
MKIAFISPYNELTVLVKDVSNQMGVQVDLFEAAFEGAADILSQVKNEKYDIVISRGATHEYISKNINIPVLNCGVTSFDMLYAVFEASKISNNIALILPGPVAFDTQLISEILKVNLLHLSYYQDSDELQRMVKKVISQGAEVIIGGILTIQYAKALGRDGVLLKTSAETVRQVIGNAIEIVAHSQEKMLEAERFKNVISFSYDGIIVTDLEGKVTVFNPAAEKIMGIQAEDILNKKANEFIPTTGMLEVALTGKPQLGQLQKIKNNTILTNRIPIQVQDKFWGVVATFQETNKIQDWEMKIRSEFYKKGLVAKYTFEDYIGSDESVRKLIKKAQKYAETDSTILITGESGTGKEILAQSIHRASQRKDYPFVAVNCSAIPEQLLESELFGYEEGAFSGAKKGGKIGYFELAHKGTIFLDEIGSISKSLQANLLRVLQEKEVWRIGSNKVVQIDVRVIAATNNDLWEAVGKREFRSDLYYRLNVLSLQTIPLRERKKDIIELFNHFVRKHGADFQKDGNKIEKRLMEYDWPGNVREFNNFVERLLLLQNESSFEEVFEDFKAEQGGSFEKSIVENPNLENPINVYPEDSIVVKRGNLKEMEDQILRAVYQECNGNTTHLAQKLNISRTTVWKRLKELGEIQMNDKLKQ